MRVVAPVQYCGLPEMIGVPTCGYPPRLPQRIALGRVHSRNFDCWWTPLRYEISLVDLVEYEEWGMGNSVCGGIQLWFVCVNGTCSFAFGNTKASAASSEMSTITGELPFIAKTNGQLFGTER